MTGKDKPAILKILKNTPEFEPHEIAVAEEVIDSYLNDPAGSGYHILVAETGSSAPGYICYGATPLTEGTWDIYWIAVDPKEQARGIGKALLSAAENDIKNNQGRLILIETSSKPIYEKTRDFHKSQGYDIICRIPDFYAPEDDKVIFQKRFS
jgi:ribosomal protein S18 acetylase RimI-like enzyme